MGRKTYPKALSVKPTLTIEKRLKEKIDVNPISDCWHFQGAKTKQGYGVIKFKGVKLYSHRLFYAVFNSDIKRGQDIHHKCYCNDCVNPYHLQAVDLSLNRAANKPGQLIQC